jgi:hypothetical protein
VSRHETTDEQSESVLRPLATLELTERCGSKRLVAVDHDPDE